MGFDKYYFGLSGGSRTPKSLVPKTSGLAIGLQKDIYYNDTAPLRSRVR